MFNITTLPQYAIQCYSEVTENRLSAVNVYLLEILSSRLSVCVDYLP